MLLIHFFCIYNRVQRGTERFCPITFTAKVPTTSQVYMMKMTHGMFAGKKSKNLPSLFVLRQEQAGTKYFLVEKNNVRKPVDTEGTRDMTDAVITEYAGAIGGRITRYYQYTRDGIRVLDGRRILKRLYLFDPSSDMMTERDIRHEDKILRRFLFDRYGMIEETFSFGHSPRKFRYENGGRQIIMREGGDFGAVGKTFTFEQQGISETAYGRDGEIERVFAFAPGDDAIIERSGGWYGNVARTLAFSGIRASLFSEPEAFLQFLMFTEQSLAERDADEQEQVAKIRGEAPVQAGRSKYAYTGTRHTSASEDRTSGRVPVRPDVRAGPGPVVSSRTRDTGDTGIDFVKDGDKSADDTSRDTPYENRKSSEISFEERSQNFRLDPKNLTKGKSTEISYEERRQGKGS
jgi:hypothetical protein